MELKPSDVKQPDGNVVPSSLEPTKTAQPTPGEVAGASSKPQDAKPEGHVPLAALHEERSRRQELEAELQQLRSVQSQPQQSYQAPQQPQPDYNKQLEELWESDPKQAVRVEMQMAMEWKDKVDGQLENQADQLSKKYPDFNNYRGTTLNYIRTLPLNQRGQAGILEAAYYMVRGQNVDVLLKQREDEWMERYRRGELSAAQLQSPAGGFSAPAPQAGVSLNDEQRRVAAAMGMSEQDYARNIKGGGA